MKIKYSYILRHNTLWTDVSIINAEKYNKYYSIYLANAFQPMGCSIGEESGREILEGIFQVERGELEYFDWDDDFFYYFIYKDRVEFKYFYDDDFYEDWSCPTLEYKRALLGWLEFIKLPKNLSSYLELKINDL